MTSALRFLSLKRFPRASSLLSAPLSRGMSSVGHADHLSPLGAVKRVIGDREVVGFGYNGQPNYMDRADFPLPAVRFRVDTPDIKILREKERGDWKKLSIEEKKALYRSSFCQTFAEMNAPNGQWKSIVGFGLFYCSLAIWIYMFLKTFVYGPLPDTFSLEKEQAQMKRMIDLRMNPVFGISSKWDYEKNDWKK